MQKSIGPRIIDREVVDPHTGGLGVTTSMDVVCGWVVLGAGVEVCAPVITGVVSATVAVLTCT